MGSTKYTKYFLGKLFRNIFWKTNYYYRNDNKLLVSGRVTLIAIAFYQESLHYVK